MSLNLLQLNQFVLFDRH